MPIVPETKKTLAKKRAKPASASSPKVARARKVTGTVLKIVSGKPTDEKLGAEKAFGDIVQARAQIMYVEKHGSREDKRLVAKSY